MGARVHLPNNIVCDPPEEMNPGFATRFHWLPPLLTRHLYGDWYCVMVPKAKLPPRYPGRASVKYWYLSCIHFLREGRALSKYNY